MNDPIAGRHYSASVSADAMSTSFREIALDLLDPACRELQIFPDAESGSQTKQSEGRFSNAMTEIQPVLAVSA